MRVIRCAALVLAACASQKEEVRPAEPAAAPAPAPARAPEPPPLVFDSSKPLPKGLEADAFDLTANPCTDFYQYACGGWMAKAEIPADRPITSRGFVTISDRNELLEKEILEAAAAGKLPKDTAFSKQLGDYYATCIDEPKLEKALPEVQAFVKKQANPRDAAALAKSLGALHSGGITPFFDVGAIQDFDDATKTILSLDQAGLGMPDRDYYLKDDEKTKGVRALYVAWVEQMFTLFGEKPEAAKASAATVLALETRLAQKQQSRVERRDPKLLKNRVDLKGLEEKAPKLPWKQYLEAVGAKGVTAININSVAYFEELSAIFAETKPAVLSTYLTWHTLRGSVNALPKAFQDASFTYTSKALSGAKEDRPRWKKCVAASDALLGEALGREFVKRHFGEDGKARTNAMVVALQQSAEKNLASLAWFDEATRAAALVKVKKMVANNKVGYPNVWRDYAKLSTSRGSYFTNAQAAIRFEAARQLAKVGKPIDRNEWGMSPPTVNAYYDPQKNEIVFPAGILQPPFFSKEATDAVNFGAMGMVVGHEITHGFDDEGRQFDADGNLKDWWTKEVGEAFVKKAQCVKQQYDGYTAIDDVKVKGDLTLGENVADLGGLKLAHQAMLDWYAAKGLKESGARYTEAQQFFLGYGQSWCTKLRPEFARVRAATDPHSPPYWRVNGPLGNLAAFKAAFQCSDTSAMVRSGEKRCEVW